VAPFISSLDSFTASCGLDPFNNIDSCTVALDPMLDLSSSTPPRFVAICRGTWDQSKLWNCFLSNPSTTISTHGGRQVAGSAGQPSLTFLEPNRFALGDAAFVNGAIDGGSFVGSRLSGALLAQAIATANASTFMWLIGDRSDATGTVAIPDLANVTTFSAHLSADHGVAGHIRLDTASPFEAVALQTKLSGDTSEVSLPEWIRTILGVYLPDAAPPVTGSSVALDVTRAPAELLNLINTLLPTP
jgi:hypothetical protein